MLLFAATVSFSLYGQNNFFAEAKEPGISITTGKRVLIPEVYRTVTLNQAGMELFLKSLPSETGVVNKGNDLPIKAP